MKIFKISAALYKDGFREDILEIEIKETDKCYVGRSLRLNKEKLLKIDTIFYENHQFINYFTYCLDGQQDSCTKMLRTHVAKKVNQYKTEIDILLEIVKSFPQNVMIEQMEANHIQKNVS